MKKFGLGISAWFDAWGFIFRHRLTHYFLYPLLFMLLWTWAASAAIGRLVQWLRTYVMSFIGPLPATNEDTEWWGAMAAFFHDMAGYALHFILWLAFTWIYFKLSKYIVLIMMSPIMALLSERTEQILTDNHFPFEWSVFVRDVIRGVLMTLRNFCLEMVIMVLVMLFNFAIGIFAAPLLVIVSPMSTVFLFIVGAYFYGFSLMDYNCERARLTIGQSARLMWQNKEVVIAIGSVFSLWLLIPFVGTFLGTIIAPISCVVAGTLVMHKMALLNRENFKLPRSE